MVAASAINLKPRKMTELFDQAFRLYRNNFLKFIGIIAIVQVPIQIIQLLVSVLGYGSLFQDFNPNPTSVPNPEQFFSRFVPTFVVSLVIGILSFILIYGVATAALTRAVTASYLGEDLSISGAYLKIRDLWGRLLLAMLLVGLLSIPLVIWAIVPCIGWLTGFGMLLFLGIVVSPLIAPIIVVENRSASSTIRRAWELARRRFWWLGGFFLLLIIFNLLVIQGPVQLVALALRGVVTSTVSANQQGSILIAQLVATSIISLVLTLIYIPLQSVCATLAYFDLRIRQEGFDLAMIANQASETPLSTVDLASQSLAEASGPLITWKEMGFFALISAVGGFLYAILYAFLMLFAFGAAMLSGF
jgi:hypothetical protein